MANKKISQLTAAGPLTGSEPLPIVQGGVTVKTTISDVKAITPQYSGIDLSTDDYAISGPGAYSIAVGSPVGDLGGKLIFPDPSLYPGQLILIETIDAGSESYFYNTFGPIGSGINGSLGSGFFWIIYSINNRWISGLFYY